jgi:hypothetical protein
VLKTYRFRFAAGLTAALAIGTAAVIGAPVFTPSAQPYGYAPSLAITGFDLSSGTQKTFQTWFDPNVWRGDLVSYPVARNGSIDGTARLWYASQKVAAQDWNSGRRIVTRNGAGNVAFRWANLSAAQQTSIGDATTGPKILNFVRGDRSNEKQFTEVSGDNVTTVLSGSASGVFRARANVLGDIIHGRPVYVGTPPSSYAFDGYSAFKSANASRPGVVYVGANDGMLHAFDAATGSELFAYIPSMLVGTLKTLSVDPYTHNYFVDGGLAVGDVNLGTSAAPSWSSVLVGGLGAGGKGLFALDVTSASVPDETTAANKIMWEITSASTGFADLGYDYSDPQIVRLNNGQWAAIVGNGYMNGGSGKSVLYVIDVATGALIKALTVGSGSAASPGGLSAPTPVDSNADGKVDFVYAGDIDGNLWKFDLRNATPANWTPPAAPLYTAPMPIIAAPDLAGHPLGGFMIYFGTGRLFTQTQGTDKTAQNYIYGLWDGAPAGNNTLLDQTLSPATFGSVNVRTTSAKQVNWSVHKGWRTALPPGEHALTGGFVRDGRYQFTTVDPTIVNAIKPNGANWLLELDYLNGGTDGSLIFDLNGDGRLNDSDRVTGAGTGDVPNGTGVPVGVFLGSGLYSQPLLALVSPSLSTTLFNLNPYTSPGDVPTIPPPPPTGDTGVAGGHFDFDVYHGISVSSFKHTHRYDDRYNVVGSNFENASDPTYNLVNTSIAGNRVQPTSQFFVLLSNGDLSPGVTLTIAGVDYKAYQFPNKFDGTQPTFTAATAKLFQFRMPTDAFASKDWGQGVVRAGLMPTSTGCVKNYPYTPGPNGEIHNGALTVWIVKADTPASAIALNVAGKPEKGYKVTDDQWVLKKYTVFWHTGACYGQPGWTATPAPDPNGNSGVGTTPAAGSEDPRGTTTVNVISVTTSVTPAATKNGNSTRVTTTVYADGSAVVVTEIVDKKGKVVSRSSVTLPPGAGAVPPTPGGNTPSSPPPPKTGYNQSRKSGKIGRVAWHELIKE